MCYGKSTHMINLKCSDIHDHCYCIECFNDWYIEHKKQKYCIACIKSFDIENVYLFEKVNWFTIFINKYLVPCLFVIWICIMIVRYVESIKN